MDSIDLNSIIDSLPFPQSLRYIAVYDRDVAKELMKEVARQVLELAAEKALAKENPADYGTGDIWVDKDSIMEVLKLVK